LTDVSFLRLFTSAEIDARHGAASDPLPIDDWAVRADIGQDFGHYPTREAAERAAQAIALEREAELDVNLPDGRMKRTRFAKSSAARLSQQ
jgi:hypothetical protein